MYNMNHSYQAQAHANGSVTTTPALDQLRESIHQPLVDVSPPDLGQFSTEYAPGSQLPYNDAPGSQLPYNDQLTTGAEQEMLRKRLERKEKMKAKRKANKTAKRAQAQAIGLDGEAADQPPPPKRNRPSPHTYNEGKALPQGTGPIQHYVLVEASNGAPLDEAGRLRFLGCYTRALALLPRESPHRGFNSTGVILHLNKIKINCLTAEGAASVLCIVEQCNGYRGSVCMDEKMTRLILGLPRYMTGIEVGGGQLVIQALEALNHAEEDSIPLDGMKYVSTIDTSTYPSGPVGLVSVVLDVKDTMLDWLKRHRWELKTVASVARAQPVKNTAPQTPQTPQTI